MCSVAHPLRNFSFHSTMCGLFVCLNVQKTEEEVCRVSLSRNHLPKNTTFVLWLTLLATHVFFHRGEVCVYVWMFSKWKKKSIVSVCVRTTSRHIRHVSGGSPPWQLLFSFNDESFVFVSWHTENRRRSRSCQYISQPLPDTYVTCLFAHPVGYFCFL